MGEFIFIVEFKVFEVVQAKIEQNTKTLKSFLRTQFRKQSLCPLPTEPSLQSSPAQSSQL